MDVQRPIPCEGMRHAHFLLAAAAAMALLGPASPAHASHVQCGATITTDTRLDSDVVCPANQSTGITIGANDVTLQLAGFTITGDGTYGVRAGSGLVELSRIEIRGGTIDGFFFGVDASASDSLAAGLKVTADAAGIYMRGTRNTVLLSDVTVSTASLEAGAIVAFGNDSHITRNAVRGLASYGIRVSSGFTNTNFNNSRIAVNTVECAGPGSGIGIQAYHYESFAVIAQNRVTRCFRGIEALAATDFPGGVRVRRNTVTANGSGIGVSDPAGLIWRNTANGNTGNGIGIGQPGNTVQENAANDNGGIGINAPAGTTDGGGNTASGNGTANCVNVSCGP